MGFNDTVLDINDLFTNEFIGFDKLTSGWMSPKRKPNKKYNAIETFHMFQDMVLNSAKKSEIDGIKEVYANTEIFDISMIKEEVPQIVPMFKNDCLVAPLPKEISLPFEACFVQVWEDEDEANGIFIKEYSPEILTGAAFMYYKNEDVKMTTPFTINLNTLNLIINKKDISGLIDNLSKIFGGQRLSDYGIEQLSKVRFADIGRLIQLVTNSLDTLNKREILVDSSKKSEYYTFKDKKKRTIKVENRKIYYIVDKKTYATKSYHINPMTKLEYSHAFKVRGHWRRISPETCGKDRKGVYRVELKGYTWVKDFVKGEGELCKKIRIMR